MNLCKSPINIVMPPGYYSVVVEELPPIGVLYVYYIVPDGDSVAVYEWDGYQYHQVNATADSSCCMTDDIKQNILNCFAHVAWADDHGQDYYDALYAALYPPVYLVALEAHYTQSGPVYQGDSLDSLKSDLVVVAHYSDYSSIIVPSTDYTLSGVLLQGVSHITVLYGGETATFTVNVSAVPTVIALNAVYTQSGTVYDTDSLDSLKADLVVTATYADSTSGVVPSANYTLSGTLTAGTSTITVSYGGVTDTFNVTVTHWTLLPAGYDQVEWISSYCTGGAGTTYPEITVPADDVIELQFNMISNGGGGTMFQAGGATTAIAFYNGGMFYDLNSARAGFLTVTLNADNTVRFGNHYITNVDTEETKTNTTQTGLGNLTWRLGHNNNETAQGQHIINIKHYHDSTLIRNLIPCIRTLDSVAGYYDIVQNEFIYGTKTFTTGSVV